MLLVMSLFYYQTFNENGLFMSKLKEKIITHRDEKKYVTHILNYITISLQLLLLTYVELCIVSIVGHP